METLIATTQLESDFLLFLDEQGTGSLNEVATTLSTGFFQARRAGLVLHRAGLVSLHRTSEVQLYRLTEAGRAHALRLRASAGRAAR
jgi:hypothetical protein